MKDLILDFWNRSINGTTKDFDYESFIIRFKVNLYEKLSLHGMLHFNDYLFCIKKYYDINELKHFEYIGKHSKVFFTKDDIIKAIFYPRYEYFVKTYSNNKVYNNLLNFYLDMDKENKTTPIFIDKCIHLQHQSSFIVGLDINVLRKQFELDLENKKLMKDDIFGILNRNGLIYRIENLKYFNAAFLDFSNLKSLNMEKGYEEVNNIFRKIFSTFEFRYEDIVGRWFSGDEIVIVSKNIDKLVERFRIHCKQYEIYFKFNIFRNTNYEDLKKSIGEIKQ
jgi:GGDEF domain-containing protein